MLPESRMDNERRTSGSAGGDRKPTAEKRPRRLSPTSLKGLLVSQGVTGYQPLRRNRRQRLDELQTGDGRPLPKHLKAQITRELDRLELLLTQNKAVETERDALLAAHAAQWLSVKWRVKRFILGEMR
jgi:transposase